jgi:hypothetical protein
VVEGKNVRVLVTNRLWHAVTELVIELDTSQLNWQVALARLSNQRVQLGVTELDAEITTTSLQWPRRGLICAPLRLRGGLGIATIVHMPGLVAKEPLQGMHTYIHLHTYTYIHTY